MTNSTPDVERSIFETVPAYVKAVFIKWWWLVGIAAAVASEIAFVFIHFQFPPAVWVGLFVVAFLVANVQVFHQMRPPTDAESLGLPYWASMTTNASADGTWLVVIQYGFAPKKRVDTAVYQSVVAKLADHFGFDPASLGVDSFGSGVRVRFPAGVGTPRFMVEFGGELVPIGSKESRAFAVSRRINDNPLHIGWVLSRLDEALTFLLATAPTHVTNPKRLRRVLISLNGWPEKGITIDGLLTATPSSKDYWAGNKATATFTVSKNTDAWTLARQFGAMVLGQAGYMGFEDHLASLTREDCLPYRQQLATSLVGGPGPAA
jgi:hypothetical protein